jgi:hypothetical protein
MKKEGGKWCRVERGRRCGDEKGGGGRWCRVESERERERDETPLIYSPLGRVNLPAKGNLWAVLRNPENKVAACPARGLPYML